MNHTPTDVTSSDHPAALGEMVYDRGYARPPETPAWAVAKMDAFVRGCVKAACAPTQQEYTRHLSEILADAIRAERDAPLGDLAGIGPRTQCIACPAGPLVELLERESGVALAGFEVFAAKLDADGMVRFHLKERA